MLQAMTRMRISLQENWLFFLALVALIGAFLFLRTPQSVVASVAEVEAIVQNGQPTLIEFYSNF